MRLYDGALAIGAFGRVHEIEMGDLIERRRGSITVSYPGRKVITPKGLTILETSMRYNVPHASVCGGKARCSTCRVRVISDRAALPPPTGRESFVLARVGASANPAIRLACQLRPKADVAVIPLLPANIGADFVRNRNRVHIGEEHYIDGGIVNSIPVARAVALGARSIYVLQVGRLERPLEPPRRPWEVGLVAFEVARRHRFAHDLQSLPSDVELHVMPTGGSAAPAYNDLAGQIRVRRAARTIEHQIDSSYEASRRYLQEL